MRLNIILIAIVSSVFAESPIDQVLGEWNPVWSSSRKSDRKRCDVNVISKEDKFFGCLFSGRIQELFVFGLKLQQSQGHRTYMGQILDKSHDVFDAFRNSQCRRGFRRNRNIFFKISEDKNILIMYEATRNFYNNKMSKQLMATIFVRTNIVIKRKKIEEFVEEIDDPIVNKGEIICLEDKPDEVTLRPIPPTHQKPNTSTHMTLQQPEQIGEPSPAEQSVALDSLYVSDVSTYTVTGPAEENVDTEKITRYSQTTEVTSFTELPEKKFQDGSP